MIASYQFANWFWRTNDNKIECEDNGGAYVQDVAHDFVCVQIIRNLT